MLTIYTASSISDWGFDLLVGGLNRSCMGHLGLKELHVDAYAQRMFWYAMYFILTSEAHFVVDVILTSICCLQFVERLC